MSLVTVSHLSKKFRTHNAVDDLSFSVEEGDVYGFLGQNGAGKSTTIRMLLTLVKPTTGSIEIFGLDLNKERNKILRQVGAVIEKPDLYKYLTAYENLSLFARMSGSAKSKKELQAQLEMVGLSGRENDPVKTYSQGMKQRLGIAIALVHNPRLVVCDEPTSSLDHETGRHVMETLRDVAAGPDRALVVVTHDSRIFEFADRIAVMDDGRIVRVESPPRASAPRKSA